MGIRSCCEPLSTTLRCQNLRIVHRIQNLQKIFPHFLGGFGSHRPVCLKKAKKNGSFLFGNLNFVISIVNFLQGFWSFWDMIWKNVSFLSLDNQFNFICRQTSIVNLDINIKSFIRVTKYDKKKSPPSTFLTIKKLNGSIWIAPKHMSNPY